MPIKRDLYKNCTNIHFFAAFEGIYLYTPKNVRDSDLFNELISKLDSLIPNDSVKQKNIIIQKNIDHNYNFLNQLSIGDIVYPKFKIKKCNLCGSMIPFDMDFYTDTSFNKTFNLCNLCYRDGDKLHKTIAESGLYCLTDWVCFCSVYYINKANDFDIFCNLNKNSIHYGKFAINIYIDHLGYEFNIVKETTIEEILTAYVLV